ncbi:hypothetical protein FOCC_FOCC007471 [Frankliniella occidentalis]|nr:hypothetical protein FOCC_FOCC007471 [Frankliniella occidentalis]
MAAQVGPLPLNERVDMLAVFIEANRVPARARRLYGNRYPLRRLPARSTFVRLFANIQVHGAFEIPRVGNRRVVGDEALIALVEAQIVHNPHAGQRGIAHNVMASRYAVQTIIKRRGFHPYKVHLNQQLHGEDFQNRLQYCFWVQAQLALDPTFTSKVLFSDESTFYNDCTANRHNSPYYALENPHWVMDNHVQDRRWSVNVWGGVIGRHVIGSTIHAAKQNVVYAGWRPHTLGEDCA